MSKAYTDIEAASEDTDADEDDKITKEQDEEIMKRKERQVGMILMKIKL